MEIGTKDFDAIIKKFVEYRNSLAESLQGSFDSYESNLLQTVIDKFGLPKESIEPFQQSLYDYKMAYTDRNPANELSKEETEQLRNWMKEMGIKDEDGSVYERFASNFVAYKKYLTSKMPVEITHVITDNERQAVEALMKQGIVNEKTFDSVLEALLEYKTNFAELDPNLKEVSKEEMEMLYNFCKEHDIKTEVADGWIKDGSYLAFKAKVAARCSLSATEREHLDGWLKKDLISEDAYAKIEERILAYKASFNMTVASKPDGTAVQALQAFLTDLGIDKKSEVFTTCIKGYTGYIETLVNEIM